METSVPEGYHQLSLSDPLEMFNEALYTRVVFILIYIILMTGLWGFCCYCFVVSVVCEIFHPFPLSTLFMCISHTRRSCPTCSEFTEETSLAFHRSSTKLMRSSEGKELPVKQNLMGAPDSRTTFFNKPPGQLFDQYASTWLCVSPIDPIWTWILQKAAWQS